MRLTNNFFFYLLCFLPLLFITGPFLTDLSLSLIGLYYIFFKFIKKEFNFIKNKIFIFLTFFYFWLLITGFFSQDFKLSLFSNDAVIFYFRYIFFVLGVALLLNNNFQKINILINCLIFVFIIVLIDGYFQFFTGFNILGFEKYETHRLTSFFKNETIVGQYLVKIFPIIILLYLIKFPANNIFILGYIVISILLFTLVLLSGERLSFFILFSFIIGFAFYPSQKSKLFWLQIILLLLLFFVLYQIIDYVEFRVNQTLNQLSLVNFELFLYTPAHEKHYISALKMFIDRPILGVGPSMFQNVCDKDIYFIANGCASHPHNFYIQMLAETGLIGFLFLFFAFCYLSYKCIHSLLINNNEQKQFLIFLTYLYLIILFFPIIPQNNFYNNHLNFLIYYPVGIMVFLFNYNTNNYAKNKNYNCPKY